MDQDIISKLRRIQALIDGAATQGEADAAAAAYQRLVMKHNLDAENLNLGDDPQFGRYDKESFDTTEGIRGFENWRLLLIDTLCHFNFCKAVARIVVGEKLTKNGNPAKRTTGAVWIIGEEFNRAAVIRLYQMLAPRYERLAGEVYRSGSAWRDGYSAGNWRKSFLRGCPSGLFDKLKLERDGEIIDMPGATALVVRKDEELDAATEALLGEPQTGLVKSRQDDAYLAGYAIGRNTQLEAQLDALAPKELQA